MTSVLSQNRDEFVSNLFRQLLQLRQRQLFDLGRIVHHLEITAHSCRSQASGDKDWSFISPAAFFSNCCIFNSASANFAWQIRANFVPSSYLANNASRGKSSD